MSPIDAAIAAALPPLPRNRSQFAAGVGDIDECWIFATETAISYSLPGTTFPTVKAFRAAAGNPDRPGPTGGDLYQIARAVDHFWPSLLYVKLAGVAWDTLERFLDLGYVVSVALTSRYLPSRLRFGFLGGHQCAIAKRGGRYWLANPLADDGTPMLEVPVADLRAAVLNWGGGLVLGIAFPPPKEDTVRIVTLTPQAGDYRVAKGTAVRIVDSSTFAVTSWKPASATGASYDALVTLAGDQAPTGRFLRAANGAWKGDYVERVAGVTLEPDPDPRDAALAAANRKIAAAQAALK